MTKIILDTDIGDDIDDALALALIVNSNELQLLGITTVFRNAERRAKLVKKLLQIYGLDNIPVYAGMDIPFIEKIHGLENDRYDNEGRFIPCQYNPEFDSIAISSGIHAVEYIIETVSKMPNEIIIVAIGPLTNLAFAIRKDPSICKKIKSITMMGGMYTEQIPEWNVLCDPEAAQIVFTSGIPISMIGLDLTLQCKMSLDEVNRLKAMKTETAGFLGDLIDKWLNFYKFECPVLHDPLAVATVFNDQIVQFEERFVDVELCGEARGSLNTRKNIPGNKNVQKYKVNVGVTVDRDLFLNIFLGRVIKQEAISITARG